jgi:pSer/pThr/pTyr-binding forkhead associated (FHA) protein
MVSRKHGKIIPQARAFHLQDLGSINGTFINQVRSLSLPFPSNPTLMSLIYIVNV